MRNRLAIKKIREKTYRKNKKKNKNHTRQQGRKNHTRRQGRKNRTRRHGRRNSIGGTILERDNFHYYGNIHDRRPHGQGIMMIGEVGEEGEPYLVDMYNGEWNNGKMHGKGEFIRSNGDIWEGIWDNGIFKKGKVTYPNGVVKRIDNINTTLYKDLSSQFSNDTTARANLDLLNQKRITGNLNSDELTKYLSKVHPYFSKNKI